MRLSPCLLLATCLAMAVIVVNAQLECEVLLCQDCIAKSSCGFCRSQGNCTSLARTAIECPDGSLTTGPALQTCPNMMTPASADRDCNRLSYTDCYSCLMTQTSTGTGQPARCSWCPASGVCSNSKMNTFTSPSTMVCASGWTDASSVDSTLNALSCVRSSCSWWGRQSCSRCLGVGGGCGWCASSGVCVGAGSYRSPVTNQWIDVPLDNSCPAQEEFYGLNGGRGCPSPLQGGDACSLQSGGTCQSCLGSIVGGEQCHYCPSSKQCTRYLAENGYTCPSPGWTMGSTAENAVGQGADSCPAEAGSLPVGLGVAGGERSLSEVPQGGKVAILAASLIVSSVVGILALWCCTPRPRLSPNAPSGMGVSRSVRYSLLSMGLSIVALSIAALALDQWSVTSISGQELRWGITRVTSETAGSFSYETLCRTLDSTNCGLLRAGGALACLGLLSTLLGMSLLLYFLFRSPMVVNPRTAPGLWKLAVFAMVGSMLAVLGWVFGGWMSVAGLYGNTTFGTSWSLAVVSFVLCCFACRPLTRMIHDSPASDSAAIIASPVHSHAAGGTQLMSLGFKKIPVEQMPLQVQPAPYSPSAPLFANEGVPYHPSNAQSPQVYYQPQSAPSSAVARFCPACEKPLLGVGSFCPHCAAPLLASPMAVDHSQQGAMQMAPAYPHQPYVAGQMMDPAHAPRMSLVPAECKPQF